MGVNNFSANKKNAIESVNNFIRKNKDNFLNHYKLSGNQKKIIENVNQFIWKNKDNLSYHYYSVIQKNSDKRAVNNHIYEDIELSDFNAELLNVSVVVLTANFFECEILNYNVSKDNNINIKKLKDGINVFPHYNFRRVDAFLFKINEQTILHLHAPETGSNTPCGSTDIVRYIANNQYLYPSCIISFGICYGINPEKESLGCTLIANNIYPCSIGIKIEDKDWHIKHDEYILRLNERYNILYHSIDEVIKGKRNNHEDITFENAIMCNMLTGEAVVSNERFKIASIEKAYGCEIKGGEMEGYGLAKECIYYSNIPCVILKSICDWGACKNIGNYLDKSLPAECKKDTKGQIQAYTAFLAYTVLKKLFYEEVFCTKNLQESLIDNVIEKFSGDGYFQEEILKKHILTFLKEDPLYSQKLSLIDTIDDFIDFVLTKCLINTKVLEKKVDGNIIGYVIC